MAEALKTCFAIDCYTNHEDRMVTRPKGSCNVFLTKAPRDIMIAGPSLRVDPDLFVICMIRDPRDIITSKHKKDPDRYWTGLSFWKEYTRQLETLRNHPRFIPIKYEEFVSDPDKVQNQLHKQLPFLEKVANFSQYHEAASVSDASKEALQSVRPIKPTSVGKWKKHKARVAGQMQQHGDITPHLIKYGYEIDNNWLEELENIAPDLQPSHHPEALSFKKKRLLNFGKYLEAGRRMLEHAIRRRIRITHPKKWI